MDAFNRQDVEATSQLFTEDRIVMRTGMDAVHGREGHFASLFFLDEFNVQSHKTCTHPCINVQALKQYSETCSRWALLRW